MGTALHANAIDLLVRQHRSLSRLLGEYSGADGAAKRRVFDTLSDTLVAHGEIEEKIFYPALMAGAGAEELRAAGADHIAIRQALGDLSRLELGHPRFEQGMRELRDLVERHVEEEEGQLFPAFDSLDGETLAALGEMMDAAFDRLVASGAARPPHHG